VPDDPDWTADQLAAVRVIDAYDMIKTSMWRDPANADLNRFREVLYTPQLEVDSNSMMALAQLQRAIIGDYTVVEQSVGDEATVNGNREIVVLRCLEDNPGGYIIDHGVQQPVPGDPRWEMRYVVQWVEVKQQWLIVERIDPERSC
jgi:hypothetical protein